jgi:hypothetical protein
MRRIFFFIPCLINKEIQTAPEMYCLRAEHKVIMTRWMNDVVVGSLWYPHHLSVAVQPWSLFQFLNLYTVGRTPWTRDLPVARPLPRDTKQHKHTDIHASSGIRTHGPSVLAGEHGSYLRPRGHCDRQDILTTLQKLDKSSKSQTRAVNLDRGVQTYTSSYSSDERATIWTTAR